MDKKINPTNPDTESTTSASDEGPGEATRKTMHTQWSRKTMNHTWSRKVLRKTLSSLLRR